MKRDNSEGLKGFKKLLYVILCLAILQIFSVKAWSNDNNYVEARDLAKAAYHKIEGNVFYPDERSKAFEMLKKAYSLNPKEPYTRLGASLAILVNGYKIGDWYQEATFVDGAVEKSIQMAKEALKLDKSFAQSYSHLGRLYIIKKNYKEAKYNIDIAKGIDNANFYPWYFEGILFENIGNAEIALNSFNVAEKYITHDYQLNILNNHRSNVAILSDNQIEGERIIKENIRLFPDDPYVYEAYATLLKFQKRYDESIVQWENALKRGRYKNAEDKLAETILLRDSEKRVNTNK